MTTHSRHPDHELDDRRLLTTPTQVKALTHPLRDSILDLLLERAATVKDLAAALKRPASTVAFHVDVLHDAGLLRVVRTRRIRAVEERTYGRTARLFVVGDIDHRPNLDATTDNPLTAAAVEAADAHAADRLRSILRRVRINHDQAADFWRRIEALADDYADLERHGDTMHTLSIALYPSDHHTLPDPDTPTG
jgi:predicted ArsR family transcriptional regulator